MFSLSTYLIFVSLIHIVKPDFNVEALLHYVQKSRFVFKVGYAIFMVKNSKKYVLGYSLHTWFPVRGGY